MTELEALHTRHSVRKYLDRPLEQAAVVKLKQEVARLNSAGGLNMQLIVNEPKAFTSGLAYGVFSGVSNYVMVIGKKSPSLPYRAGYCAEKLMLFARALGLDTCCVGLTYKKVKETFKMAPDEKILVSIAVGYGAENGWRSHKVKSPEQVSNISETSPEWFRQGVEAALLAPTAVNQQKFRFEFIAPDGVRPSTRFSLVGYTKIDLGIAMCNFEIGAGVSNFRWIDSPLTDTAEY